MFLFSNVNLKGGICIYGKIKLPSSLLSSFHALNALYSLCELIPVLTALLC